MRHNKNARPRSATTPAASHLKRKLRRAERIARRFEEHGFADEVVQQAKDEVNRLKVQKEGFSHE
jgi:HAMP domain-containing protein